MPRAKVPIETRFWNKIDKKGPDECWTFNGAKLPNGYGLIWRENKLIYTHRLSLELALGRPISDGLFALHNCDNPSCCNPTHLREGTHLENMNDRTERGRTFCSKGEINPASKLTADQVLQIRKLYAETDKTQQQIADEFGVSAKTISKIVNRQLWKHI